jgi:hypothetical protein
MADAPLNQLTYLGIDKPILPYRTNTSPVDESPHWVYGAQNAMATINGWVQKRPGFAIPIESLLSVIPGTVTRLFTWRRFSGSFFVMASVSTNIPGSMSQVWKLEVGVDQSFSIIYADTVSTTSQPFDFITSNNFVFFGNGTIRQNMRKYNGTAISTVYRASLWGLDFPVTPPSEVLTTPSLPPGLTFNGTTLSGTPATAGTYSITFTATDSYGDTATQSLSFTIATTILEWNVPSGALAFAEKGVAYSNSTVTAWGGVAPYTYALVSGVLPPGLSIAPMTGAILGTPTATGNFSFAVQATDSTATVITRVFSIFVGNPSIAVTAPAPPNGTVGAAYTSAVHAIGGTAPYTYIAAAGTFPPGLMIDAVGNVTGTPSVAGVYPVTFQVTDSLGVANQVSSSFTVYSNTLAIATQPEPPEGKVGYAYSYTPFASGGTSMTSAVSGAQTVSGDWQLVGTQYRTINEPVTTALSDLVFRAFPLSIPLTSTILGVSVSTLNVSQATSAATVSQVSLWSAGAQLGTIKNPATPFTTSLVTAPYGSASDNWGAGLTPAIVNSPSFGFAVAINLPDTTRVFIGKPWQMTVYYTSNSGAITLTAAPNAITAQTGYIYGQTFTSIYGHESSMSALSSSTGIFTNLAVIVSVLSSADPQVNGINIYRTTDGGDADPEAMRLLASLPNMDATFVDSTQDIFLGSQTGPALYINDPPQPLSGFVWSNGRIWGKTGANTWFTGNEEVTNGIPAECMSDAINGNYYGWPSEVGGMAVTSNGVDIGLDEQFWQISGDALSTFRKSKLLQGGGTRYPINIMSVGDTVYWIDTAKQVWSSTDGEIGEQIRPDLATLTLSQAFIGFHKSKLYNWIYVLDAAQSILYVYNLDLSQWNIPWKLSGGVTAITSGEIAVGSIQLIIAFNSGHVLYLDPSSYTDDGVMYTDTLKSNLLPVVPGRGSTARNAAEVRQVVQFDMEVSTAVNADLSYTARTPDYFGCLVDDDPAQSIQDNYFNLSANICDPQYQDQTVQKRYVIAKRWMVDQAVPRGRRIAFEAQWNQSANAWTMYSFDVSWRS